MQTIYGHPDKENKLHYNYDHWEANYSMIYEYELVYSPINELAQDSKKDTKATKEQMILDKMLEEYRE